MALLLIATASHLLAGTNPHQWPQFRGPHGDGVAPPQQLAQHWPATGPARVWQHPIGPGYGELVVVGTRIFTLAQESPEASAPTLVLALDRATGNTLWSTPIGAGYESDWGNGPRATPTVSGNTLFALAPQGEFAALSLTDGTILWKTHLTETLGAELPGFGYSASPVVIGDYVYLQTGSREGQLTAFNTTTGEPHLTALTGKAGYMTPLFRELLAQPQLIWLAGQELVGLSPNGQILWRHPWENQGETIATPVFLPPDRLFISSVKIARCATFQLSQTPEGFAVRESWSGRHMRSHFQAAVAHNDHLYGFDNAALKSIAAGDGALKWQTRGFGKGALIRAGDHLLILSDRGLLVLADASPDAFTERARFQVLDGRCWTAPALVDGKVYLRNNETVACYDLSPGGGS